MKYHKKRFTSNIAIGLGLFTVLSAVAVPGSIGNRIGITNTAKAADDTIILRVCNWEEYMDLGEWAEDEIIDLESGDIYGELPLYEEFEDWYYENYGQRVKVEYSCFGTNEELYNMLTLGDTYDLVCPSEYMIMKLMSEDWLVPYSDSFFNEDDENNYYVRNVSPYIKDTLESHEIDGMYWDEYMAGYMWGITGILYNPEEMTREEASTWSVLNNPDFYRQVTIKDNVRDSYFAALGAIKADLLTSEDFVSDENYSSNLMAEMNDVSDETIQKVQDYLQDVKNNVYSFETDSGKADMITGKVHGNYQWSGDAVYAMDQAEEDGFYLEFAVPTECTNMWFDGWVMLKKGISEDPAKQQAAEAFVNFLSMPENAVRNMYYIGYTSVISGGMDGDTVFEYLDWNYGAEEDEQETVDYDLTYFFDPEDTTGSYVITAPLEQTRRQLYAQYPTDDCLARSAIMEYFDADVNAQINQMWINVRCFNLKQVPIWGWIIIVIAVAGIVVFFVYDHKAKRK
ncbi:MAG: extracellular solute-binding protein [Butyrivibrio sp.]|nr:extracellular solute-binding protein [Butyrivibrio sp.]